MSATTHSCRVDTTRFRETPKHIAFLTGSLLLFACYLSPRAAASTIYTLAPGANVTALGSSYPTGGTMMGTETSPFSFGTISGTLVSTVYSGDTSNPYGGLTFTYLLELNSSSTDSASEFTVGGFTGYLTDVSFDQRGNEVAPSNFTRSASGNVIHSQWNTVAELPSGDTGALVVVQTGAFAFGNNTGTVTDSTGGTVAILAPVPEPGAASLLAVGFGTLFFFRRRGSN